jgi:hypothetical protein
MIQRQGNIAGKKEFAKNIAKIDESINPREKKEDEIIA